MERGFVFVPQTHGRRPYGLLGPERWRGAPILRMGLPERWIGRGTTVPLGRGTTVPLAQGALWAPGPDREGALWAPGPDRLK